MRIQYASDLHLEYDPDASCTELFENVGALYLDVCIITSGLFCSRQNTM